MYDFRGNVTFFPSMVRLMSRLVWLKNPILCRPSGPTSPLAGNTCVLTLPEMGLDRTVVGGTTPEGPPAPSGGSTRGGNPSGVAAGFFGSGGEAGTIGLGIVVADGPDTGMGGGAGAGVGTAVPLGDPPGESIDDGSGGSVNSGGLGGSELPGGVVPPAGVTGATVAGFVPFGRTELPGSAWEGLVPGAAGTCGWRIAAAGLVVVGTTAAGGMGAAGAGDGVARLGAGSRVTLGAVRGTTLEGPPAVAGGIGYTWGRWRGTSYPGAHGGTRTSGCQYATGGPYGMHGGGGGAQHGWNADAQSGSVRTPNTASQQR